MNVYRAYFIDSHGTWGIPMVLDVTDDASAIDMATRHQGGSPGYEVWQGNRLIIRRLAAAAPPPQAARTDTSPVTPGKPAA